MNGGLYESSLSFPFTLKGFAYADMSRAGTRLESISINSEHGGSYGAGDLYSRGRTGGVKSNLYCGFNCCWRSESDDDNFSSTLKANISFD